MQVRIKEKEFKDIYSQFKKKELEITEKEKQLAKKQSLIDQEKNSLINEEADLLLKLEQLKSQISQVDQENLKLEVQLNKAKNEAKNQKIKETFENKETLSKGMRGGIDAGSSDSDDEQFLMKYQRYLNSHKARMSNQPPSTKLPKPSSHQRYLGT